MAKIGRNAPCPCDSGRKYKKCCGSPLRDHRAAESSRLHALIPDIDDLLRQREAQELVRIRQQGLGRPIISAKFKDHRFVAVANRVYFSKDWKFFTDFLFSYILDVLNRDWCREELTKPFENRHPVMQWYDICCRLQAGCEKRPYGAYRANMSGVFACYLGLAYNLYLLKHNVDMQERLVARLRIRDQFQGAYYELIVANCLIRAGFDLTLEDETDAASKHCEFSATSDRTGKRYWVEAKMKSISGLLGKTDADGAPVSSKPTSSLSRHLREALAKPAPNERLIFIDLNAPPIAPAADGSAEPEHLPEWFEASIRRLDDRERDLKEGERAYVFVTNMAFHRQLDGRPPGHGVLAYGLGMEDFSKPRYARLSEHWRSKQEHIDAYHIMDSLRSYPNVPSTFDGDFLVSPEGRGEKIEIGRTYFFPDIGEGGMLGRVTTATLVEEQKKIWLAVIDEKGRQNIIATRATDEEIDTYNEHPEAYFGQIINPSKQTRDPYEFFEFMMEAYIRTPKDKLLQFLRGSPDLDRLKELEQTDLALEYCERVTLSAIASGNLIPAQPVTVAPEAPVAGSPAGAPPREAPQYQAVTTPTAAAPARRAVGPGRSTP